MLRSKQILVIRPGLWLAFFLLAGCGQTGPLFLAPPATPAQASQPEPAKP